MKHTKWLALALATLMLTAVFCGCASDAKSPSSSAAASGNASASQEGGEILIGVIQDMTGPTGQQGLGSAYGIEMLAEEINANGGVNGKTIKLVVYDCVADVEEAINAYKRLCEQDHVVAVCGAPIANIELSLGPLAESYKVPIVAGMIDENCVIPNGALMNYLFMCQTSAGDQGTTLAKYAEEDLKATSAGVMYDVSNAYSVSLAEPFIEYFESKGYPLTVEAITGSDSNYLTQLNKIKAANPDVLYFPIYPAQVNTSVTQAREVGMNCPILGSVSFIPNVKDIGAAAEGNVYWPHPLDFETEKVAAFDKAFEEKYGFPTNAQVFIAQDSLKLIVAAIEKIGDGEISSENIKNALEGVQTEGWAGTITMSAKDHMLEEGRLAILNLEKGEYHVVKTTSVAE